MCIPSVDTRLTDWIHVWLIGLTFYCLLIVLLAVWNKMFLMSLSKSWNTNWFVFHQGRRFSAFRCWCLRIVSKQTTTEPHYTQRFDRCVCKRVDIERKGKLGRKCHQCEGYSSFISFVSEFQKFMHLFLLWNKILSDWFATRSGFEQ